MKNIVINGANNEPIALDFHSVTSNEPAPLVIYSHGFNGFKDWGNGNLLGAWFASNGMNFLKFNFSHNGTSPDQPTTFCELEKFGHNNYSKQLIDLKAILDWIHHPLHPLRHLINYKSIILIGHSMGGTTSILYAKQDKRISQLVTWAAPNTATTPWTTWDATQLAQWKQDGVAYYDNKRTQQKMPLYLQLLEDYENNEALFQVANTASGLTIPWLICHATDDQAVPVATVEALKASQPSAALWLGTGGHTFGRQHPATSTTLPPAMQELLLATRQFIVQNDAVRK